MTIRHCDLHSNTTDTRALSGGVWCDFPFDKMAADPSYAYFKKEDWIGYAVDDALSAGGVIFGDAGPWLAVQTASGTEITVSATAATGELVITDDADDNDEVALGFGDGSAGCIEYTQGVTGKPFWMEASLQHSALTNSFAIGLFLPADIAAATLTDNTGVVKNTSYIAAGANYTDGKTSLYGRSKATGQTARDVDTDMGTLVAAAQYRIGLTYKDGVLRFYVNGLETGKRTMTSTDCTDGSNFTPCFFSINDAAGADVTHNLDWVAWGQER
jgi:hypothetical protein